MPAKRILSAALALLLVGTFAAPSQTSAQNSNTSATHLFWSRNQGTIARARLDGSEQNLTLITEVVSGGFSVLGDYIYWNSATGTAKSTLSGETVSATFMAVGGNNLLATDQYIYWSQGTKIGRANIDGTGQNADFITGIAGSDDIASDGTYLYWSEFICFAFKLLGRNND